MSNLAPFTGHRVDAPDRPAPRFPASRVAAAALAMTEALPPGTRLGVSSAANGGDILFLEACTARAIPCHIVLPFPAEDFVRRSVATDSPGDWEARFHSLWSATPETRRHVLSLPEGTDPFAACNDALLTMAARLGSPAVIALWDGREADGPSGTADLVAKARTRGWPVTVIAP